MKYRIVTNDYKFKVQKKGFFFWVDCGTRSAMGHPINPNFSSLEGADSYMQELIRSGQEKALPWKAVVRKVWK